MRKHVSRITKEIIEDILAFCEPESLGVTLCSCLRPRFPNVEECIIHNEIHCEIRIDDSLNDDTQDATDHPEVAELVFSLRRANRVDTYFHHCTITFVHAYWLDEEGPR